MVIWLAFSMLTSAGADILLMHKWLLVGDAGFTEKAEHQMCAVVSSSGVLVLVSHLPTLICNECNRVIHLEHGRIVNVYAIEQQSNELNPIDSES